MPSTTTSGELEDLPLWHVCHIQPGGAANVCICVCVDVFQLEADHRLHRSAVWAILQGWERAEQKEHPGQQSPLLPLLHPSIRARVMTHRHTHKYRQTNVAHGQWCRETTQTTPFPPAGFLHGVAQSSCISCGGFWLLQSQCSHGRFLSHRLRPVDVEFMKALHEKVNIIPLIAKADCLTPNEIKKLKDRVSSH